jgi:tRNA pseudouridine32 synthase/23S rRNA pseudouridine746 synthase
MFKIIAQLEDFIVVDKAAGMNFHDEGEHGSGLFSLVKVKLKLKELYPVHRLDKMTSGLVIFAKTLQSTQRFGQLFERHEIEKYYIALSDKKPTKKQGLIKGDMAKSRRGSWKLLRTMNNPAITQFFSYSIGSGKRLYLLKPHSGKTHQLRVALSSTGANILGDTQYSGTHGDRGYLHAYSLQFEYLGEIYQFIAPPTQGEFFLQPQVSNKLDELSKPWQLNWPKL